MQYSSRALIIVAAAALLASCATRAPVFSSGQPCVTGKFTVVDGFSGARRGTCTVLSKSHVRLDIRPESEGEINNSPWYAFKLSATSPITANVSLQYYGGYHRYWPKISEDGLNWTPLDAQHVLSSFDGRWADIAVPLTSGPVWIAAQEIITPAMYDAWNRKLAEASGIPLTELGSSTAGLPIAAIDSNAAAREVLLLVGRQHPPEVSGAFAFFAFTETIFGNTELASEFRARFRVIAIPLLNPDGVIGGNWRHNLNGVDLNRDWGPFTQPETKPVGELLDVLDATNSQLRMFVDFHSTKKNVFYTQTDVTTPPGFTATWLENARARVTDYPFENDRAPSSSAAIAKNYIYTRYGIPAVTFEVGDETDRRAAQAATRVFAEELMRSMLEQDY